MRRRFLLAVLLALLAAHAAPGNASAAGVRDADPVVLQGAELQHLQGAPPGRVVAFRWQGGWRQVPVQVDERAVVHIGKAYADAWPAQSPQPVYVLTYTDPGTFIGPDPVSGLDGDDEVVLMARDAGSRVVGPSHPAGVRTGSATEVLVREPGPGRPARYVYLFRSDGTLSPAAGRDYVDYRFALLSGDYRTTYELEDGPNPENSSVTSAHYSHHFSDRWISDELRVMTGEATGVDILDRHKFTFTPGACGRTENTFVDAEGAFVVNRDGPVRALRSYLGANSGPYTQRTHVFYDRREDIITHLRVHPVTGGIDFFDYSPAAAGMTYANSFNRGGIVVDGVPDQPNLGHSPWESMAGPQGGLSIVGEVFTDIQGMNFTHYWFDDSTPSGEPGSPEYQCTGDPFSFGASGPRINGIVPNTDPREGPANYFRTVRHLYFEAPAEAGPARAQERQRTLLSPLLRRVRPRARVHSRLQRVARGPLARIAGSVCPAPRAATRVTLQRRRSNGGFVTTRRLAAVRTEGSPCARFGPAAVSRPGAFRVRAAGDDLQSGGVGRTLRVARRR